MYNIGMIECYFDGACLPTNPGHKIGMGAILKKDGQTIKFSAKHESKKMLSNNVAEYESLIILLSYLIKHNLQDEPVTIYGDSTIVVNAINRGKPSKGICKPASEKAIELSKQFKNIVLKWIPRDSNYQADLMSNNQKNAIFVEITPILNEGINELFDTESIMATDFLSNEYNDFIKNGSNGFSRTNGFIKNGRAFHGHAH